MLKSEPLVPMNVPLTGNGPLLWTGTLVWGLPEGVGGGLGGGGQRGKKWDDYNRISNKIFKLKKERSGSL